MFAAKSGRQRDTSQGGDSRNAATTGNDSSMINRRGETSIRTSYPGTPSFPGQHRPSGPPSNNARSDYYGQQQQQRGMPPLDVYQRGPPPSIGGYDSSASRNVSTSSGYGNMGASNANAASYPSAYTSSKPNAATSPPSAQNRGVAKPGLDNRPRAPDEWHDPWDRLEMLTQGLSVL